MSLCLQKNHASLGPLAAPRLFVHMITKKIPDFAASVSEVPGTFMHSALYWQDIMDVDRVFCENYCELCEAYPGHKAHEAHCKGMYMYCRMPGKRGLQQNASHWTDKTTLPFSLLNRWTIPYQGSLQPGRLPCLNCQHV